MKLKKSKVKKSEEKPLTYYVFSKYRNKDSWWYFHGSSITKEDAEIDMEQVTDEPEDIEYMVIKGYELHTYDGVARYPVHIDEKLEDQE